MHLKPSGWSEVDVFRGDLLAKLAKAMAGKKPPLADTMRLREKVAVVEEKARF